ncbi:MAG: mucoidy inhibitor MuiA family protein [Phycisphaerae bacterium]|nr:mucoidy inhibitor MuiA family protein [Phycisphaerae bacterium]
MNTKSFSAVVMLVVAAGSTVAAGEAIEATSKIEAVTVYRGQALVARSVAVPKEKGELEIVVPNLPARVVPASLSASAADGVTIRSVRYLSRAAAAAASKEAAEMDAAIKKTNNDIYANAQMIVLTSTKGVHVSKLEDFSTALTKASLVQGKLDLKALGEVTAQVFKLREALAAERIKLNEKAGELKEQLALLQRKRKELTSKAGKTIRQAVIFLSKTTDQPAAIRLNYLVGSANWSPAYNVRLGPGGKTASVEYLAEVNQTSGEDWSNVQLTLSTVTPAMNARSPLLVPLWIALRGVGKKVSAKGSAALLYSQRQIALFGGQYAYLGTWNVAVAGKSQEEAGWNINRLAAENQRLELNVDVDAVTAGAWALRSAQAGLAVSYRMPGKMNLASRSDRQLIQIAKLELPAATHYQAIPLLSSYVYHVAEVTNTSALPLLEGQYSSYLGGQFVGRGRLRLVARGQKAIIGFGVDTQLRCSRELSDKSDRISWGSRVQAFRYRLRLENYKDGPVSVRLLDRIPATKGEDLRVTLGRTKDALSTDQVYLRDHRPRGILRWEITLPARATGATARDVIYTFEMKYAKDKHIGREAAEVMKKMRATHADMFLSM